MKEVDRSKNARAGIERQDTDPTRAELMADIPGFTREQWKWVEERTREFGKDYVPTRTVIRGL